jgi:hypothetical protein
MDEQRLVEIEQRFADRLNPADRRSVDDYRAVVDLLAEVRRLRKLSQDNDRAYSDGASSGHADIVGILLDPEHPGDDAKTLAEIKAFLGVG